jgi:uncharacterized protein (TIGR03083 family)
MTATDTRPTTKPRRSALDPDVAMRLAATEYQRFLGQLRTLDDGEWALPTDCPAWDVREMAAHSLGMAEMVTSFRENVRQNRTAQGRGGVFIDALTGLQVEERAGMRPSEIVSRYEAVLPSAVRGRRRMLRLLGRLPLPVPQTLNGMQERWTFGYLFATILTRDPWMHRVDIARATGRQLDLSAEHDGAIVADVVAEWEGRHDSPYALRLTGVAGGTWARGTGGPELELDAVEFCRTISGRGTGTGLLAVEVPF